MKKIIVVSIFLIIGNHLVFSQNKSEKKKIRVYEIGVIKQPQTVKLIEYENGKYEGEIITEIVKGKWGASWLRRTWKRIWHIEPKDIVDKYPIKEGVAKELMAELKDNEIETIKNPEKWGNFLDGASVVFKIKTKNKNREYSFEEIYPKKDNNIETDSIRAKAQKLITILYKKVDLEKQFSNLFKRLPKGYYNYFRGAVSIIEIRNRKR